MDFIVICSEGDRVAYKMEDDESTLWATKHFHPTSKGSGPNWDKGIVMRSDGRMAHPVPAEWDGYSAWSNAKTAEIALKKVV